MNKLILSAIAGALLSSVSGISSVQAQGQDAVLAEFYGQGVHAYHAGKTTEAYELLSMAINNGSKDPRAYYFRGIVASASGRGYEADSDWQQGADLEARGEGSGSIGAALSRFQGSGRIKLEEIRRKARMQFVAESAARSRQRYGSDAAAAGAVARPAPAPRQVPAAGVTPPPAPPAADDNPFPSDMGEPKLESDDALADAMEDPFANDAVAGDTGAPADAPAADPFGGDAGGGADPFGGNTGGGADPFGGDAGGGADPFGDDPFGN
ncbi:MAG: hypothetical protein WBD31_12100 [Rubripirellula sp.]